ncbi:MAG: shikimate kinase [Syntrophales bacterium]|jgi:shikimate kinase|nr:shikimate kinase [Syntrophales bacterium]
MNIILIGYRCTGKTSIGRLLSEMSGRPFFDTDELVCSRAGKNIAMIVADAGWAAFREKERSVIEEVSGSEGVVIATGGGAVLDPANVQCLKKNGRIIWLVASADTVSRRMEGDVASGENRPPLSGESLAEEVRKTLVQREPLYRQSADLVVDTDALAGKEVAAIIGRAFPEIFGLFPPGGARGK